MSDMLQVFSVLSTRKWCYECACLEGDALCICVVCVCGR